MECQSNSLPDETIHEQPYFRTMLADYIVIQRQSGNVCSCGRTQIEHVFEPSKCCEEFKCCP